MAGNTRFDYIGFANGGKEVGPQPGLVDQADTATGGLLKKGFNAGAGNVGRLLTLPGKAIADARDYWMGKASGAANSALKATTGYEIPYEYNGDYGRTSRTVGAISDANQQFLGALGDNGILRKAPTAQPRQAIPGPGGSGAAPKMGPGDLSKLSNGQVPTPRRPGESLDQYFAKNSRNFAGTMFGSMPAQQQQAMPAAPPQTQLGTFQVEGGKKRSFSADTSGAWYEGGKPMGGVYGAAGPGAGAGGMGRGNAEVNAIVNRLLSQQPGQPNGLDRRGLPMGMTRDEFVNDSVSRYGWNPASAADYYMHKAMPASTQLFSAQQGADYNRGMLGNQTAKTQLDALMTPSELAQRGAMADMYNAHAQQYRTMSDPNFLLKMKGKDAETEQMKARNDLMKTLLPKAYEAAIEFTKREKENNPKADANALFNSYMSNAMKAYTDEYSQGKRYSEGMAMPGEKHWLGHNSPEVNIPGGWQSQDQQEFYQDFASEMESAKQITDPDRRALRIQELMNLYSKGSEQFRG